MRHARVMGLAGLAVAAIGAAAYAYAAQTTVVPVPDNEPVKTSELVDLSKTTWGDAKAGQTKAAACAACHGADGNPSDPQYPRLAGQSERYTAHQLALFASGERNTGMAAVMVPFAQTLTAQDMRDVGAYFATQKSGAGLADDTLITEGTYKDKKFYEVGQQLYHSGDTARGIPACMACHGPTGAGNPGPAYPHVGGQQQAYVVRRLEEYRAGTTGQKDPALFNIMAQVTHNLTDQEIQALGSYLQGLHDRADDAAVAQGAKAPH
ncbi:c-type cytochrome [Pseudoxanthomonas dokdonensis]|uniref:Cytochrome C n=1 Tax=Pseudoxanthomonas dokdonensis TaxID=344882 RepID=A0A0R0CPR3_9GAMM|nr:c-type cytochrome [Pseudoxanthomonas dokdonensis]KRG68418.1 cytochrome C [Pseudoxanthomonas dokdonensis]